MEQSLVERRIAQVLAADPDLQQAVEVEPRILELLRVAADQQDRSERWQHYESLKGSGSGLVGWLSAHKTLQTTQAYEAYVAALDALLPPPMVEK